MKTQTKKHNKQSLKGFKGDTSCLSMSHKTWWKQLKKNRIDKVWRVLRVTCLVLACVTKRNEKTEWTKFEGFYGWHVLRESQIIFKTNIWTNRMDEVWRILRVTCLVLSCVTKQNEQTSEKKGKDKVWRVLRVTCYVLA